MISRSVTKEDVERLVELNSTIREIGDVGVASINKFGKAIEEIGIKRLNKLYTEGFVVGLKESLKKSHEVAESIKPQVAKVVEFDNNRIVTDLYENFNRTINRLGELEGALSQIKELSDGQDMQANDEQIEEVRLAVKVLKADLHSIKTPTTVADFEYLHPTARTFLGPAKISVECSKMILEIVVEFFEDVTSKSLENYLEAVTALNKKIGFALIEMNSSAKNSTESIDITPAQF